MKVYQIWYWCPTHGSRARFAANKRDAMEEAKSLASEINIEVSTVEAPKTKADLIDFLNSISPVDGHHNATLVATIDANSDYATKEGE
jgi:hypothetical protein